MKPEAQIESRLAALRAAGLWRDPNPTVALPGTGLAGQIALDMGPLEARSNDYLGLAGSAVSRETAGGARPGAGASRLMSGTSSEHLALEEAIAEWLQLPACLLFSSGYATNTGVISALATAGDRVFSDALNHASIIDGCRLSRADTVILPHRDLDALAQELARPLAAGTRWVVTESYFGMDGDSPDLAALRRLCDQHEAGLIVDEAHSLGVFGPEGRGLCAAAQVVPDVLVGGMGKAIGLQGGFAACSRIFREWFWNRARSFGFSTASSPLTSQLGLDHLARLRSADAARDRLFRHERRLEQQLLAHGVELTPGRHGPIFPLLFGSERATLAAATALLQLGVACQAIRPPTVPNGSSRLRVTLRADMTEAEVDLLAGALLEVWVQREPAERASGSADRCQPVQASGPASMPSELNSAQVEGLRVLGRIGDDAQGRASSALGSDGLAATSLELPGVQDVTTPRLVRPARRGGGWSSDPQHGSAPAPPPGGTTAPAPPGVQRGLTAQPRSGTADPRRWVVLGTGTEVGKTFVAEALVRLLTAQGQAVAGLKPIETGWGNAAGREPVGDAGRLAGASFHVKQLVPAPLYGFSDPVAPALAARRAGTEIQLSAVKTWVRQLSVSAEPGNPPCAAVIETAGGVFSPLGPQLTNFDLATSLDPSIWILVAPDRLGVLHDVIATLGAMAGRGRGPAWIVLSAPALPDASTGHNLAELLAWGVTPRLLGLGRGETAPLALVVNDVESSARP
jgi:8-amino-7-oxononanoate synthase